MDHADMHAVQFVTRAEAVAAARIDERSYAIMGQ